MKADHQGSKISFTDFRWVGLCISGKMLPNNNYLVLKVGPKKAQILQCMRLRHFTHRQPQPDMQITPQEWKSDPEVSIEHDELCARGWECKYEKPVFDTDYDNTAPSVSAEIAVRSD